MASEGALCRLHMRPSQILSRPEAEPLVVLVSTQPVEDSNLLVLLALPVRHALHGKVDMERDEERGARELAAGGAGRKRASHACKAALVATKHAKHPPAPERRAFRRDRPSQARTNYEEEQP